MQDLFNQAIFLKYLAALLAVFNPLYGIPVFLSMTDGMSPSERRRTAIVVSISVFAFAMACVLGGEELLAVFGIDVPSFRMGGGIIILLLGLNMLNDENRPAGDQAAAADGHARKKNIAVVPLAIPLTIGPGALVATVVFAHELPEAAEIVTLTPAVVIACAISALGLAFASPISRTLGPTTISVAMRIVAIILVAIAVELIVTGAFDAYDAHYSKPAPS